MDEIIPGLWIGDLQSAQNAENLKAQGIFSILSAMRGRITIHETFIRHQIKLDDTENTDIMTHFLPSIHFIQAELDKGRGVLVHCQAGVSRSSTIVAAYLMYSKKIDPQAALDLIKKARPSVEPNQGFLQQLELFHDARYKISRREKAIRMFYMGRAVEEVMNGDGSPPETEMFAKYPRTPSDSLPNTPGGPRRRIRCKMCRWQELATREHMLDHGQLGPSTPASTTPAGSRRPSTSTQPATIARSQNDSLSMSSIQENPGSPGPRKKMSQPSVSEEVTPRSTPIIPAGHPLHSLRSMSRQDPSLSVSALEIEDESENEPNGSTNGRPTKIDLTGATAEDVSIHASQLLGCRLSDAVISSVGDNKAQGENSDGSFFTASGSAVNEYFTASPETTIDHPTTQFFSPSDLTSQLSSNPKLAALRSPPVSMSSSQNVLKSVSVASAPILANAKCSGYFVEPMKWMEHFLSSGQLAGKITCPNKKCGAKLGNYDWAGVCCGCKEWVTPGFCINRSKVDEVI
ncbi:hypothetical protein BDZ97DRAFT_2037868 [Flammula alnicola]|nr:hypothetical protein BDZ97DRAFT_2037868 [Flammula alnicola]